MAAWYLSTKSRNLFFMKSHTDSTLESLAPMYDVSLFRGTTTVLTLSPLRLHGSNACLVARCPAGSIMKSPAQTQADICPTFCTRVRWSSMCSVDTENGDCSFLQGWQMYTDTHSHAHFFSVLAFRHSLTHCAHSQHFYGSRSDCQNHSIKSSLLTCLT